MLIKMNIGDSVQWIDKPWKGRILDIQGARARVLLEDGFDEWVNVKNLTVVPESNLMSQIPIYDSKNEEKHVIVRPLKVEEIDLHIEHLTTEWRTIPTEKILERQLSAFEEEVQVCLRNKVDELIVIHGKGKGILKKCIIDSIRSKSNIESIELNESRYKNAAIKICFSYA